MVRALIFVVMRNVLKIPVVCDDVIDTGVSVPTSRRSLPCPEDGGKKG
jgi:hypothetical protein